jgi:hypothetical protein
LSIGLCFKKWKQRIRAFIIYRPRIRSHVWKNIKSICGTQSTQFHNDGPTPACVPRNWQISWIGAAKLNLYGINVDTVTWLLNTTVNKQWNRKRAVKIFIYERAVLWDEDRAKGGEIAGWRLSRTFAVSCVQNRVNQFMLFIPRVIDN